MRTISKKKKILFWGITIIGVILFLALITEASIYLLFRKDLALFPRYVTGVTYGKFRIRKNIPNLTYYHKSYDGQWKFVINSQGFRNFKNFTYNKPDSVLRILSVGDSFTLGYECKQDSTYSAILHKLLLQNKIPNEVINAGVSGFSNAEELVFFENEGIRFIPDVVILGFFINDLDDNVRSNLFEVQQNNLVIKNFSYLPAVKIRDFLNSFSVYRWLSENSYAFNYFNNTLTFFIKRKVEEKNLLEIRKNQLISDYQLKVDLADKIIERFYSICKKNKIKFILLDIPNLDKRKSVPDKIIENKNYDYYLNGQFIFNVERDFYKLYRKHGHHHWTERAHLLIAKRLYKIIKNLI